MKKTKSEKWFDILLYALVSGILLVTLLPFWNQIVISLSSGKGAYSSGLMLVPQNFSLAAYKLALEFTGLWTGYGNTLLRTVLGVTLSLIFTSMLAYPLSKLDLPLNRTITMFILFTMIFSGGLIPSFLLIKNLGLLGTIWALVLPSLVGTYNVLIMRNFFRSLPESLEESAKVDGAGYFTIFCRITLPLSKPVLATVALWVAVYHWNAWFDAMIYIKDPGKQVLQIVLRKIVLENNLDSMQALVNRTDTTKHLGRELYATIVILSILPMLIIYPFVQKFFVRGIMLGAVKG
ncbi:putative aldouronate transport system permease protein [Paenibacillus sp. V4I9]|uniref:carbohydrate ABC transporter permease n=1 Tax=Paenibacillus sp. V4I9 TaxID=3042308 RepID=UPI0027848AEF|nr:carbohydrate ABC transporter permease [Paenibacillus sp. V4I9]MDQ0886545.1 putative aldouronate transport system permease protein [Paenibacillus sp. V4I9]